MGSSLRLSFVLGKTRWQILSGYLRFLLYFSPCLMGRSADHQLNARSAQTGKADKLMGRFADHGPTGWDALRTMHHIALFSHSRSAIDGRQSKNCNLL